MVAARNMLFVLSDEHNRKITGAYGHPFIETPNIDALAARGHDLRRRLYQQPDLRAGPRNAGNRAAGASEPVLGQRASL